MLQHVVGAVTPSRTAGHHECVRACAPGQERGHQGFVAAEGGGVQRAVAGLGRVWVRAVLEQVGRERRVATMGRHDQRAGARWRRVIHVATSRHQVCCRVQIALSGGEQHRCISALHDVDHPDRVEARGPSVDSPRQRIRSCVNVCPEVDQRRHDVRVLLRHGPHQRRLPPRLLLSVEVRSAGR